MQPINVTPILNEKTKKAVGVKFQYILTTARQLFAFNEATYTHSEYCTEFGELLDDLNLFSAHAKVTQTNNLEVIVGEIHLFEHTEESKQQIIDYVDKAMQKY
jgi:hypothetical protein